MYKNECTIRNRSEELQCQLIIIESEGSEVSAGQIGQGLVDVEGLSLIRFDLAKI